MSREKNNVTIEKSDENKMLLSNKNTDTSITKDELAWSIGFYVGGKAGVSDYVEPEESGLRGAFIEDLIETGKKFVKGEITPNEAEKESAKKISSYVIAPFVEKIMEKLVDKVFETIDKKIKIVTEPIKPFIPQITEAIEKTTKILRENTKRITKGIVRKITEKIEDSAKQVINIGKNVVKKLFGLIGA